MSINRAECFAYIALCVLVISMATSVSGYRGLSGNELFLPTNHFVSELGNRFKSSLYYVHNTGLIFAGALLFFATLAIGKETPIASACLTISSVGILGVGCFPEHSNIFMHLAAALLFFAGSACGAAIVGFRYLLNTSISCRYRILAASFVIFVFLACLVAAPKQLLADAIRQQGEFTRPSFWLLAIVEWGYLFSYTAWLALVLRSISSSSCTNAKKEMHSHRSQTS